MGRKKSVLKQTWNFLWNSDSPWSWVIDLVLAFIIVKFIIFPVLGFTLATALPLVVIESGSMEHHASDFDDWWDKSGQWYVNKEYGQDAFKEWDFSNGLDQGDVIVTKGKDQYEVGDVIIFNSLAQGTPIIHRIIAYDGEIIQTKGDNNAKQLTYEKDIKADQIISSAYIRIPKIGWLKLWVVDTLRALAK
ncbi:hypothetical protein ACFLZZ_04370 [Nanoarchaeota archaeon]